MKIQKKNKSLKMNRKEFIEQSQNQIFDVLIIGGGVTGAGIALDAASRGLKTILLEKDDFASGTSSRSTKLVHGGLRYLKNFEIKLVRESGKERAILYRNAPHIVYPQKMVLPVFKGQGYGKWITSLGLWVYDLLAGVEQAYKKKTLSKSQTIKTLPGLKTKGLRGAIQYYEYRTNDARLVIENIKKSVDFGSVVLNYCQVLSVVDSGEYRTFKIFNRISKIEFQVKAKILVNATGVWSDQFLSRNAITNQSYILPSKGIHIVVDKNKVPIKSAVYFELPDERMVFAIPNGKKVYIGTTDSKFEGDLDQVTANHQEVNYLILAFNQYFKTEIALEDIEITWAGIRPLVKASKSSLNKVSRKEKMVIHDQHTISIMGGKLTAYRLMAERVVDKVVNRLPNKSEFKPCFTKKIPLSGADFGFKTIENHLLVDFAEQKFNDSYQLNASTETIYSLFYTYGKNIELIIEKAYELYNSATDRSVVWLEAEIWYVVHHEMVVGISDFLMRRTDRFYFSNHQSLVQLNLVSNLMAHYLDWSEAEKEIQKEDYISIIKSNKQF